MLCCVCLFPPLANAKKLNTSSRLKMLINKIFIARKNLQADQQKSVFIKGSLEQTETNIGHIAKHLHQTNTQLSSQKNLLGTIQQQQAENQAQLNLQKNLLSEQTRAIYFLGSQPYLKIILNQQDPVKISRYLHYYASLNQARLDAISAINKINLDLEKTTEKIHVQTQQLQSTQQKQQDQQNDLKQEELNRKKVLQQINQSINTQSDQLNKLLQNKKQLENIISSLKEQTLSGYAPGAKFETMQHKLFWPITHTKVMQTFGEPIAFGRLKSTGVLLKTNLGEPIHAVFPGKVIFASWLNGFGLLAIIQHGQNYMTLYARNQSLYVKKDDEVKAGQVIATAGNSGGFDSPALYFEIRYKGKPVNPLTWLRR